MKRLLLLLVFLIATVLIAQEETLLPITEDVIYQVRSGDNLEIIGALFDVSPICIAESNELERGQRLQIEQELLISVACPRYGDDARDAGTMNVLIPREVVTYEDDCSGYRVQLNDNIDIIAQTLNIAVEMLASANELEAPYQLGINDCLIIPTGDDILAYGIIPPADLANPEFEGVGGGADLGEFYTLQMNETLDVIAQRFDVSLDAIIQANQIERASSLTAGTVILIPANAPAYGTVPALDGTDTSAGAGGGAALHIIQPRETVDLIALNYNVETQCLLETNSIIYPKRIQPGQVLTISADCPPYAGESTLTISPASEATEEAPDNG